MLKITDNYVGGVTTLKLEGKLSGEWVEELRHCWQQVLLRGVVIRIDLAGVAWVSDEGRELLRAMQRHGAELSAANLLMASIVAELGAETAD